MNYYLRNNRDSGISRWGVFMNNPKHKLSFCIEGAIFYEDCCGISVTINKWLDYLDSLTADIRGVGRDWWTWREMKRELSDASSSWTDYCGAVFNFVLVVNWRNEMMLGWDGDDVIEASESELHIFLNQSWPHRKVTLFIQWMSLI